MKRSAIGLATVGTIITGLAVGAFVWHTEYQVMPLTPAAHQFLQRYPSRTHRDDYSCSAAMQSHVNDYLRPVFKLHKPDDMERALQLRDEKIDWDALPGVLKALFSTRTERTVFLVTDSDKTTESKQFLEIAQHSPYVDTLCFIDPANLPGWFPRSPEPRGHK